MSKKEWARIDELLKKGGESMDTVNTKIVINDGHCDFELFCQLGRLDGRWVWVDLKMSLSPESVSECESGIVTNLKRQLTDANKSMLEIICTHASELLQSGERTILDVTNRWIATRFEPSGYCDSVRNAVCKGAVTSPLDAFAKLLILKLDHFNRITDKDHE